RQARSPSARGHRIGLLRGTLSNRNGPADEPALGHRENVGARGAEGAAAGIDGGRRRMSCEELKEAFELYSLGIRDDEERAEIEAHLARGCDACRRSLNDALAVNALMLASVPVAKPPARLKRRLMASFGVERAGWGWLGALAAACLAALAVWL